MSGHAREEVDEVAVWRAVNGDRPAYMNIAERIEATRQLTGRGVSTSEIARMLGVEVNSVARYRREIRKEVA